MTQGTYFDLQKAYDFFHSKQMRVYQPLGREDVLSIFTSYKCLGMIFLDQMVASLDNAGKK